jgi:hypothetical protein
MTQADEEAVTAVRALRKIVLKVHLNIKEAEWYIHR